ncbi:hypothetical protein F5884DRAFT_784924 [Xylogone sp. PMI_703]|nr:hypothetical protein F5884DRAFT_784924 [Xylogone sp. PMI_703]
MGSSSSKVARSAARKYPTHTTPPPAPATRARRPNPPHQSSAPVSENSPPAGPTVHPDTRPRGIRDEAIDRDASDPDLSAHNARLRILGAVNPAPTHSNSSTVLSPSSSSSSPPPSAAATMNAPPSTIFPSTSTNPAVTLLQARERLAKEAEEEFERIGKSRGREEGSKFLDVLRIRQILVMKESGVVDEEIERRMGLRKGVVEVLGAKGVVGLP